MAAINIASLKGGKKMRKYISIITLKSVTKGVEDYIKEKVDSRSAVRVYIEHDQGNKYDEKAIKASIPGKDGSFQIGYVSSKEDYIGEDEIGNKDLISLIDLSNPTEVFICGYEDLDGMTKFRAFYDVPDSIIDNLLISLMEENKELKRENLLYGEMLTKIEKTINSLNKKEN